MMIAFGLYIPPWIRLAMPEDVAQEIALAALMGRTTVQRRHALQYRLRELRRVQWDRVPRKPTAMPPSLRPSRIARITGYRTDSVAHRQARLKLSPARRRAIARQGAQRKWNAENSSSR